MGLPSESQLANREVSDARSRGVLLQERGQRVEMKRCGGVGALTNHEKSAWARRPQKRRQASQLGRAADAALAILIRLWCEHSHSHQRSAWATRPHTRRQASQLGRAVDATLAMYS